MHDSTTRHLEPLRILRPFVLAAAIGLVPAAAIAGGMSESGGKAQSINQSGSQTQGSSGQTQGSGQTQSMGQSGAQQGANQSGDQITLTQQEASEWEARPVLDQSGEKVGEVSSLTLDDQGKIEQLKVQMEQTMGLGGKTVTIEPSQFSTSGQQIQLNMTNEQIKELPGAQQSQ